MLKVPFGRMGNKTPILHELLELIPEHDLYVEAFTGSGALFFNKEPVKSILNDTDGDVVYRLKLLKKVPLFENPHETYTIPEIKKLFDKPIHTLEDAVIHEKIKSQAGFSGKPITDSSQIYQSYNPYSVADNLPEYKKLLSRATITQKDYKYILKKYDSPTTFFFLDPPYEITDKKSYKNTIINYEELRDVLRTLKGWFLLTLNDSPYIRKVFKEFNIQKIQVQSGLNNRVGNKPFRAELIIRNYS